MDVISVIRAARQGAALSQQELAERAGTSQATLSAYERGVKSPTLAVAQRILKEAGYRLDLVTLVDFVKHDHPRLGEFWVPNRLWRGKLPQCFATVLIDDVNHAGRIVRYDLRRRPQRRHLYERVIRQGNSQELLDWIDGALLIDLWDELDLPPVIREAWQPAVTRASKGPTERPWWGVRYRW